MEKLNDFGYVENAFANVREVMEKQADNIRAGAALMAEAIRNDRLINVYLLPLIICAPQLGQYGVFFCNVTPYLQRLHSHTNKVFAPLYGTHVACGIGFISLSKLILNLSIYYSL